MKTYTVQHNVGKAKHVVSFHNGVKQHKDGSPFYDVIILHNNKMLDVCLDDLKEKGYTPE